MGVGSGGGGGGGGGGEHGWQPPPKILPATNMPPPRQKQKHLPTQHHIIISLPPVQWGCPLNHYCAHCIDSIYPGRTFPSPPFHVAIPAERSGVWIQWNGNSRIVEWWNGGMVEWIFFSLILLACLRTNYCQEYIMLKQRSVQFSA